MLNLLRRIVPNRIRSSYAAKFAIVVIILGISVAAVGGVATALMSDQVEQSAKEDLEATALSDAQSVDNWLEQSSIEVRSLSREDRLRSDTSDEGLNTYLEEFRSDRGDENSANTLTYVHVVDTSTGDIVASSDSTERGESYTADERPWLDEPDFEHRNVDVTELYELDEEPYIAFYRSVSGDDDRIVVGVHNMEPVGANILSGDRIGGASGNAYSFAIDERDTILMDDVNIGEDVGQTYPSDSPVLDAARDLDRNEAGSMEVDAQFVPDKRGVGDEDHVVGYASTRESDWVVTVHSPQSQAYGFADTLTTYGAFATAGGVLLIGIIGLALGRNTAVAMDRLTAKTEEMEQGNLDVDFETKRIDNIGRLYAGFANMRDALREQIREAQQAREEAESERERVERINQDLQTSAEEYRAVMGQAADGDLSVRATVDADNEQMRGIGEDFNAMLDEIEATVEQLKRFATEVATASEEVTASSEEVRSASEQVTESIQEISDGAERQNQSLQSVSQEMSGLSTTTEEIASSSNEVADLAERTAQTGREGREAAQEAIQGMNRIESESEVAVEEIEALQQEVAQIDELLEFITEVAEQTNMLALNANIEASRSGESGEGFAVVAEEVKELAADTKDAAEDIEDRLERIKAQTDDTAREVRKTSSEITDHTDSVRKAAEALDEIADYAQETNTGVQEISAATEQQAASTQEVVAMVDEAATISEETTAESENVAAAAEQQTTALTEVSRSASDLANQASQLSEALDRFETDADAEGGLGDDGDSALPAAEDVAVEPSGNDMTLDPTAEESSADDDLDDEPLDAGEEPIESTEESPAFDAEPEQDNGPDPTSLNRTSSADGAINFGADDAEAADEDADLDATAQSAADTNPFADGSPDDEQVDESPTETDPLAETTPQDAAGAPASEEDAEAQPEQDAEADDEEEPPAESDTESDEDESEDSASEDMFSFVESGPDTKPSDDS